MARRAGTIVAGVVGALGCGAIVGVGLCAAVAVVAVAVVASSLEGCDVELDLGPDPVALTRNLDGTIEARPAPCQGAMDVQSILLRRADGEVLWSARAEAGSVRLSSVTLGRLPEHFVEDVPLERSWLTAADHQVVFSPLDLRGLVEPAPATLPPAAQLGGATASFAPDEVRVGEVLFEGSALSEDQLATLACG